MRIMRVLDRFIFLLLLCWTQHVTTWLLFAGVLLPLLVQLVVPSVEAFHTTSIVCTPTTTTTTCRRPGGREGGTVLRLLPPPPSSSSLLYYASSSSFFSRQRNGRVAVGASDNDDDDNYNDAKTKNNNDNNIYALVHRKQHEMKQLRTRHSSTTDPIRMAMSYAQESISPMRLAKALRRVYDDPTNVANPQYDQQQQQHVQSSTSTTATTSWNQEIIQREEQLASIGMKEVGMRRPSLIVDIKRRSISLGAASSASGNQLCTFDDAGMVAEAMARFGADAVFINTDYPGYGGDISELKSAVRTIRRLKSQEQCNTAVVMKDIVVDEIQLGIAKEAGADGIVLISCILGPALENFVNLATAIGLETIVECHTANEIDYAMNTVLAPNIVVNNYDRINQCYYPNQAIQLAGLFPGSGGPIISLATGNIGTLSEMKRHLAVGYDGLVVGRALMGQTQTPTLIRALRDRTLLPTELSQWGLNNNVEFDLDGNMISST